MAAIYIPPLRINQVVFLLPFHPTNRAEPRMLEMIYNVHITMEASVRNPVIVLLSICWLHATWCFAGLDNL